MRIKLIEVIMLGGNLHLDASSPAMLMLSIKNAMSIVATDPQQEWQWMR